MGGARERRHAAGSARAAPAPLRPPPAADVHPARGAEQLDGAYAAVTAESEDARDAAFELARLLGLSAFVLDDSRRVLYHAGAAIASNYLVTPRRAAGRLLEHAEAPPEALDPLMRRTIENGFELTGPISRGDWETVDAHEQAIAGADPALLPAYLELARTTALLAHAEALFTVTRTVAETRATRCAAAAAPSGSCRRWAPCTTGTARRCAPLAPSATRSS